jgi:hypothetical protein
MDVIYKENTHSLTEDDVNYLCSISGFFKNISECKDNKQVVLKNFEDVFIMLKNEDLRLERMKRKRRRKVEEEKKKYLEMYGEDYFYEVGYIDDGSNFYWGWSDNDNKNFLVDFIEENLCNVLYIIEGLKYFQADELLEFFSQNYKYFLLKNYHHNRTKIIKNMYYIVPYCLIPFVYSGKLVWREYTHIHLWMLDIDTDKRNFF